MPQKVDDSNQSANDEQEKMEEGQQETTENNRIPNCATQREEVSPLLHKRLTKGDAWYLLDVRWMKQWKKYVGFDSWDQHYMGNESAHPGPVDTSSLFKDNENDNLRDHLMEDLDYSMVPEEVWKKLVAWYGVNETSRPIRRYVVEHGLYVKHCKVEVYLVEFKLALHPNIDSFVMKQFSRGDTIADLLKRMKEVYDVPEDRECRVWHKYMMSSYELLTKMEETIQDSGLYTNQLLLLEQQTENGSWPRQSSTYTGNNVSLVKSNDIVGGGFTSGTSSIGSSTSKTTGSSMGTTSSYFDYGSNPSESGVCGLSNLGNTCFMNSAIQCLSNTYPLTEYFLSDAYRKHINEKNPLGMGGNLAKAYGSLLHEIWSGKSSYTHPRQLKSTIGKFAPQFVGYAQHDSQELLAFLLDGLHEDLNQVIDKPYVDMDIKVEGRTDKDIAMESWKKYLLRNKSVVVKLFQGQLKSTLVCPDCNQISRIFDPFMYMSLPLPVKKVRELVVYVVRDDPDKCTQKVRVTVPKHGQISSLMYEVAKTTGVDKDKLVVIDVYNCRFHKIFDSRENISHIMDRDDIYCYEVPIASADDPDRTVIPVYHREKVTRTSSYSYGSGYTNTYHQLFGMPMLVTVPRKGLTYDKLYDTLVDHMRRYVKRPSKEDFKNAGTEMELPEAGVDEVDKQQQQSDAASNMDTTGNDDGSSDDKPDGSTLSTAPPKMFSMCYVNGYGSQVLRVLSENEEIKPTNNTYVACDWATEWREKCYDSTIAEHCEYHDSMRSTSQNEKKKNINLLDCVKLFTVEEQLGEEDPWYCPKCKDFKRASKKFDLWKLPEILVIHLKRFTYNRYWRDKLDLHIDFPVNGLDLRGLLINQDDPEPVYDLFAVANHYGGMGGGHYTAYAKNSRNGKWYHFDDSHVSQTDESHLVNSSAYVLFYVRRGDVEQPAPLLRRMSSYTHRDPSQDEPDKKNSSSDQKAEKMQTEDDNGAVSAENAAASPTNEGNEVFDS